MTIVIIIIAGALVAGARWLLARRRPSQTPGLHLTQAQVDRVIASYQRDMQEDQA